ncbi:MAG: VanZ family protein [Gammaproteobacteria bacterium]|nr:VanZ family protein [Gammaproteobacteria bacterium]
MLRLKRQPLKFFGVWLTIGVMLVAWVCYESLTPSPISVEGLKYADKLGHFFSYFTMMAWFGQLFQRRGHWLWLLFFIALGYGLELLQLFSGYRSFEYADLAADAGGALLAWVLASTKFRERLLKAERYLA